jgi:putative iron-regulated protein
MEMRLFLSAFVFLGLISCSPERQDTTSTQSGDLNQVVETYAKIVHATYVDSLHAAREMDRKIDAFLAAPTEQRLLAAKESWISARLPYLQTEVYRFYDGPIDDKDGPEGLLNAWPMDEAYLDYVKGMPGSGIINDRQSYPEITRELIIKLNEKDGEENISCGYHAIEFLLWGQDLRVDGPGSRPHTDYTTAANADRRKKFLNATVSLLLENLQGLVNEWAPSKENYRSGFVKDDAQNSIRKILSGMTLLSGFELAGERLLVAYESRAQEDEHSCFSDTTHNDAIYDIVGLINVWAGSYKRTDGSTIEGPGIQALAAGEDPAAAEKLHTMLISSLSTSREIPRPFDQAILAEEGSDARTTILSLIEELEDVAGGLVALAKQLGVSVSMKPEP